MNPVRRFLARRRAGTSLTCRDAVALLSDYLDETLSPDELKQLRAHLAGCGSCAEYLDQLRASIRLTAAQDPGALDPATRAELTKLFRDARDQT